MADIQTHRETIDEVKGDRDWSALEADLLAECSLGLMAYLPGKEDLPADCYDPERRVRAGLIRYLMLGGCDSEDGARPHPKGVLINGGWIEGKLDLEACDTLLDLSLLNCFLPERPNLRDAQIGALHLYGCTAPEGVYLHRLSTRRDVHLTEGFRSGATVDLSAARIGGQLACSGGFDARSGEALACDAARIGQSVFLRDGFCATAEVDFRGAEIGGQLDCSGGRFEAPKGRALNCQAARIAADVFLRGGFCATAEVNFVGAEIGGQVDCSGGSFEEHEAVALDFEAAQIGADVFLRDGPDHIFTAKGLVDFTRAEVSGNLLIEGAEIERGLSLRSARVGHALIWERVHGAREFVDLRKVKLGALQDDADSWVGVVDLKLDGLRYDHLSSAMSIADRIAWLGQASHRPRPVSPGTPDWMIGPDFNPQPHVQLANVLRDQGDRSGAARVLVDRERRQRRAARLRAHGRMDGTWRAGWLATQEDLKRPIDFLFGVLVGYGHRPMRAVFVSLVLIALASWLAGIAYEAGQFAPNSDVILTSEAWLQAVAAHEAGGPLPLYGWLASASAQDYETFHPFLYGLDLFIPLDALGQEAAWRPTTGRGWLGDLAFYSRAVFQSAGWIITAMAAAVLTGLVGRRD